MKSANFILPSKLSIISSTSLHKFKNGSFVEFLPYNIFNSDNVEVTVWRANNCMAAVSSSISGLSNPSVIHVVRYIILSNVYMLITAFPKILSTESYSLSFRFNLFFGNTHMTVELKTFFNVVINTETVYNLPLCTTFVRSTLSITSRADTATRLNSKWSPSTTILSFSTMYPLFLTTKSEKTSSAEFRTEPPSSQLRSGRAVAVTVSLCNEHVAPDASNGKYFDF